MRIVLTNAGKKEIIYDESEKVPPKNLIKFLNYYLFHHQKKFIFI